MKTQNPIAKAIVVLREEFDDWAVLFNPDTAEAVGINPVGVEVWKLMDGAKNLDAIVAEVKESFDGVPESVFEEINAFVIDLEERGFIGYELDESGE